VQKRPLTTQRLFAVLLGGMAGLMVLAAIGGAYALDKTSAVSNRLSDRISPAATEVVELRSALVDQETAVRGYLLSGERGFLDPYTSGQATEKQVAAQIETLLADQPAALDQLRIARDRAAQWRTTYAEPMIAAATSGAGGAAKVDQNQITQSKNAFDAVRGDMAKLQDTVGRLREAARGDLARARTLRDLVFLIIVVVFVIGLMGITVLLRVAVLRPLAHLGRAAREVASGDFDQELPRTGPSDLADDLDGMRGQIAEALARSQESGRRLEQQTAELRRSNSDLEQFAYVASHDLQEPLRKVASFCQMLQRRYESTLDDRGRQYIAFAVDGATRMQALINDLLAFSRVGRLYDSVDDVVLEDTFRRAESDLSEPIAASGATIEHDALPPVRGDRTLLAMLWQNLLANAIKFAKPGVPPHITVTVEEADTEWRFTVTDNGIGIEPQFAEKIFVIFQRLHPRDQYPGTGIGLAMCKRIVEFHGGRIWLDTEYQAGARISFTMPRGDAEVKGA
jgi:signal transduction histidine kinase